jgi:hypothetical protein
MPLQHDPEKPALGLDPGMATGLQTPKAFAREITQEQ